MHRYSKISQLLHLSSTSGSITSMRCTNLPSLAVLRAQSAAASKQAIIAAGRTNQPGADKPTSLQADYPEDTPVASPPRSIASMRYTNLPSLAVLRAQSAAASEQAIIAAGRAGWPGADNA